MTDIDAYGIGRNNNLVRYISNGALGYDLEAGYGFKGDYIRCRGGIEKIKDDLEKYKDVDVAAALALVRAQKYQQSVENCDVSNNELVIACLVLILGAFFLWVGFGIGSYSASVFFREHAALFLAMSIIAIPFCTALESRLLKISIPSFLFFAPILIF